MKRVLAFLILCMALALARVLLMALAAVLLLALVHAFIMRPRETLVFVGTVMLSILAVAQPLAFIVTVGVVCVTAMMLAARRSKTDGCPPPAQLPRSSVASGDPAGRT